MRDFVRFWQQNLLTSYRDWERHQIVGALIVYVLTSAVAVGAVQPGTIQGIATILAAVFLLWLGILVMILNPSRLWNTAKKETAALQEHLEPRLDILFGGGPPFEQTESIIPPLIWLGKEIKVIGTRRLFRIGVKNIGATTVDDVQVVLESAKREGTEENVIVFAPVPLHQMHDNPKDRRTFQRSFELNPDETRYIDVIQYSEYTERLTEGKGEFELQYSVSDIPNLIPVGRYKLTILAHGRNTPPRRKHFLVYLDSQDRLHCQLEPD